MGFGRGQVFNECMRAFRGKSGRCRGTLEISTEALRLPSSNYGPLVQLPMPRD